MTAVVLCTVCLHAQAQTAASTVSVYTDRTIIPEGAEAPILIKASRPATISLTLSGLDSQTTARLSSSSFQLTETELSTIITLLAEDNGMSNASKRILSLALSADPEPDTAPGPISFTIPPDDLSMQVQDPATFRPGEASKPIILDITPDLQSSKSFAFSLSDHSEAVLSDFIITHNKPNSFPITVQLKEGAELTKPLDLRVIHLDTFTRKGKGAQISAGSDHSCAIKTDGTMACWGDSGSGQTNLAESSQGNISDAKFLVVSAGYFHNCAIKIDGTMACWGSNESKQTSPTSTLPLGRVTEDTKFLAVAAGDRHSCAIKIDGTMACWGRPADGRTDPTSTPPPGRVTEDTKFLAVAAGAEHNCAIKIDGTMACWGDDPTSSGLRNVDANTRFLAVGTGGAHNCAIKIDGTMTCWGWHGDDRINPASAGGVDQNTRFLAVSTGHDHNCAIKEDSTMACWGKRDDNRTNPLSSRPENQGGPINAGTKFLAVSAGTSHTCAIKEDGTAACWGRSVDGQTNPPTDFKAQIIPKTFHLFEKEQYLENVAESILALDAYTDRSIIPEGTEAPILIKAVLSQPLTVNLKLNLSGEDGQTTARLSAASIQLDANRSSALLKLSVDDNDIRHLSSRTITLTLNPQTSLQHDLEPIRFTIPPDDMSLSFKDTAEFSIDSSRRTVVASVPNLKSSKTFIISSNDDRLIVPTGFIDASAEQPFPVIVQTRTSAAPSAALSFSLAVSHLDSFIRKSARISLGSDHSCAIKEDRTMACWGNSSDNRTSPLSSPQIDANDRFLAVGAGGAHNCAIKIDGTMACWGLADDNRTDPTSTLPIGRVTEDTKFLAVSTGDEYSCAIKTDGTMACWGRNHIDQANPLSSRPENQGGPISAGTKFLALSAGSFHSCAIKTDSTMACWGWEDNARSYPPRGPKFLAVSAGAGHSCAIKADGTMACWGDSSDNRTNPLSNPQIDANDRFLAVSAGHTHTCAIKIDGTMACWGLSRNNQTKPLSSPQIDANDRFLAVSAGEHHNCAIKTERKAVCWGFSGPSRTSPTTALPDGSVTENTRFLAVADTIRLFEKAQTLDGIYTVSFDKQSITLAEGELSTVRISIDPPPPTRSMVTGTLTLKDSADRSPDSADISVNPKQISFSSSSISQDVVIQVPPDEIPELEKIYTVAINFPAETSVRISGGLSIVVPASDAPPTISASQSVIPEGSTAYVLVERASTEPLTVSLALSVSDNQTTARFSPASIQLTEDQPLALFSLFVENNDTKHASNRTLSIRPALPSYPQHEYESAITLTIPPDDLRISSVTLASFRPGDRVKEVTYSKLPWQDSKTIFFSPDDDRIVVPTGFVTVDREDDSIKVAVKLGENVQLGRIGSVNLVASYWDTFTRDSAQIDAGLDAPYTCAVREGRTAECWGLTLRKLRSHVYQLDFGVVGIRVGTRLKFLSVSAGSIVSCGLKEDRMVQCYGVPALSNLANSPQGDFSRAKFLSVSTGGQHSCGVKMDNAVVCWGDTSNNRSQPSSSPQGAAENTKFLAVSAGQDHSCAVKIDGTLACWGYNGDPEHPDGRISPAESGQNVSADTRFRAVSAGYAHSCGIKIDDTLACWGYNGDPDSPDGRTSPAESRQNVSADTRFLAVSAGYAHSCGIKADRTMACWGYDDNNRMSLASTSRISPISALPDGSVTKNTRFLAVAAGYDYTCAVKIDRSLACWGNPADGRTKPPSGFRAHSIPDTFRWFEQETGLPAVQFVEVAEVEISPVSLSLNEGESTRLALFRAPANLEAPATITMRVADESGIRLTTMLGDGDKTEVKLALQEGKFGEVTMTALDDRRIPSMNPPVSIMLRLEAGNAARLVPAESIQLAIRDNDFYTIGFSTSSLTVAEGEQASVNLIVDRAPDITEAAESFSVTLRLKDSADRSADPADIRIDPDRVALHFPLSESSISRAFVIRVPDDLIAEAEKVYTVEISSQAAARVSTVLSITVPADDDRPTVSVYTDKTVVPEGESASILIAAILNRPLTVELNKTALDGRAMVEISNPAVRLTADKRTAMVNLSVPDDDQIQTGDSTFSVNLRVAAADLSRSTLTYTVPPNDLTAAVDDPAVFRFSEDSGQTIRFAVQGLQAYKSFVVSSLDPRLTVPTGIITTHQDFLYVDLGLAAGAVLNEGERPNLRIDYLDAFSQPLIRRSDQISAGNSHACAIKIDNSVACWGDTFHNQGSPTSSPGVDETTKFLALSAGGPSLGSRYEPLAHTCGIKTDRTVACWGHSGADQSSPTSSPGVDETTKFLALSAGGYHTCGIKTDSTIACWGGRNFSIKDEFSDIYEMREVNYDQTSPISSPDVDETTKFLAVSAGERHSCGIKTDHTVACWGESGYGQTVPTGSPQGVSKNTKFLAVSAGSLHSCGIKMDRTMACWGWSGYGQTMPGQTMPVNLPQDVDETTKFLAVSAGGRHSCGVKIDNELVCWGYNGLDKVSNPPYAQIQTNNIRHAVNKVDFLAISAGADYTCAVELDGTPLCWGNETDTYRTKPSSVDLHKVLITPDTFYLFEKAQIIRNAVEQRNRPLVKVYTDRNVAPENSRVPIFIKAASAVTTPLTVGLSLNPESLGVFSPSIQLTKEQPSTTLSLLVADDQAAQTSSVTFTLSLDSTQTDISPQLLHYTIPPNDLTVAVDQPFSAVSLSGQFITQDLQGRKDLSFSSLDKRAIVQSSVIPSSSEPFSLVLHLAEALVLNTGGVLGFVARHLDSFSRAGAEISSGNNHSCAIKTDGTAACWGVLSGYKQNVPSSSLPDQGGPVDDNTKFLAVSAGMHHSCGIRTDHTMACWGDLAQASSPTGNHGQTTPTSSPNVEKDTKFLAVSAGVNHTCAIKTDGSAACWGYSIFGQTMPTESPQGVAANDKFLAVSAGMHHSCGIKTDNTAACWGSQANNQTNLALSSQGDVSQEKFLALSAGYRHTCAIKTDGSVACWGYSIFGQTTPTESPQGVAANDSFLALSAGANHTCGIKIDHTVACWGRSDFGQADPLSSPQGVDENDEFIALGAGVNHTCGVKTDGTVACWGYDDSTVYRFPEYVPDYTPGANSKRRDIDNRYYLGTDGKIHPPAGFQRARIIFDTFRLFEKEQALESSVIEIIEILRENLTIKEGQSTTLALFRVLAELEEETAVITIKTAAADSSIRVATDSMPTFSTETKLLLSAGQLGRITIKALDDKTAAPHLDLAFIELTAEVGKIQLPSSPIPVTIQNNDFRITFATEMLIIKEGSRATATIIIDPPPDSALTVNLSSDEGADRQLMFDPVVSFAMGAATAAVVIETIDDIYKESTQEYTIRIDAADEALIREGNINELKVIVPEDDDAVVLATVRPTILSLKEGDAAELSISAPELSDPATITLTTQGAITLNGEAMLRLRLDAETTQTTLLVMAVDDDLIAPDLSDTISLSAEGALELSEDEIPVTIENDDFYTISFAPAQLEITEGSSKTADLSIDPAPAMPTTVTLNTNDDQLALNSSTFTFTSQNTTFNIVITAYRDEAAESTAKYTVGIKLDESLNQDLHQPGELEITVPAQPLALMAEPTSLTLVEGQSKDLIISVDGKLAEAATVTLITTAELIVDPQLAALDAETTQRTISVTAVDNEDIAAAEPATITLTAAGNLMLTLDAIPVTIINNDVYTISFSTDTVTIPEKGGSEMAALGIDPAPAVPTTVSLEVTKNGVIDTKSLSFNKDEFILSDENLASTVVITANKTGRYTVGIVLDEALRGDRALYDLSDALIVETAGLTAIRIRIKVYLEGAL